MQSCIATREHTVAARLLLHLERTHGNSVKPLAQQAMHGHLTASARLSWLQDWWADTAVLVQPAWLQAFGACQHTSMPWLISLVSLSSRGQRNSAVSCYWLWHWLPSCETL